MAGVEGEGTQGGRKRGRVKALRGSCKGEERLPRLGFGLELVLRMDLECGLGLEFAMSMGTGMDRALQVQVWGGVGR